MAFLTIRLLIPLVLFSCVSSNAFTINAAGSEYLNGAVECDESEDCIVNCNGKNSCRSARIQCPIDYQCNVTCSATNSCRGATINATFTSLFTLIDCEGNRACQGLRVLFPSYDQSNGNPRGIIKVVPPDYTVSGYTNRLDNITFYAENGWLDIDTSLYSGDFQLDYQGQGHMFCHKGFVEKCDFGRCEICNEHLSEFQTTRFGFVCFVSHHSIHRLLLSFRCHCILIH